MKNHKKEDLMASNINSLGLTPELRTYYYKSSNETDSEYIQRVVETQPNYGFKDNVGNFVKIIVKDKNNFRLAIAQLSTLKLTSISCGHNILNLTLNSTKRLGIIRFLFNELIRRDELESKDVPWTVIALMSYKNKLLQETSEPKNAKRAQKTEHLLELLRYLQLNANCINTSLLHAAIYSSAGSCSELVDKLKKNRVSQPLTEVLLGGICSDGNYKKGLLENITPTELKELIFLDRFKGHFAKDSEPIKLEGLTIRPNYTALDLVRSNLYGKLNGLEYLVQLIRNKGDADLIAFLENWLESHPDAKIKLKTIEFETISKRVSDTEKKLYRFDISKAGQKAFVARHLPETKQDRQVLKRLLGEIVGLHSGGIPFTQILNDSILSYKEKSIVYLKNMSGGIDTFEVYFNPFTKKCELVRNNLSFQTSAGSVFLKESLATALKGNRLELNLVPKDVKPRDAEYWSNWEADSGAAWDEYVEVIHPTIKHVVGNVIRTMLKDQADRHVTMLEICGGTGKLAKQIIDSLPIRPTYVLLEQNQKELSEAKQILNDKASVVPTDVVNDIQYYKDESKQVPIETGSVDIVIGSGALTECVIPSKASALDCLKKIHAYLKPGGFLILAGHGVSWMGSEDYSANGFLVFNTSMPITGKDLYILQKI